MQIDILATLKPLDNMWMCLSGVRLDQTWLSRPGEKETRKSQFLQ